MSPQDASPHDASPHDASPHEARLHERSPHDARLQDASPHEASPQDAEFHVTFVFTVVFQLAESNVSAPVASVTKNFAMPRFGFGGVPVYSAARAALS